MKLHNLAVKYPLVSDQVDVQELSVILREVEKRLQQKPGAIVEFGCYAGTTSLFLERLRTIYTPKFELHVYDSFQGLPQKSSQDTSPVGEQFKQGELYVSKKTLVENFKKAGLRLPVVHSGWFNELEPSSVPGDIAVAFLDGDYYESIMQPLKLIETKLQPGALIIIDDYQNEALPGAQKAVDEWLKRHPCKLRVEASLAILHF